MHMHTKDNPTGSKVFRILSLLMSATCVRARLSTELVLPKN